MFKIPIFVCDFGDIDCIFGLDAGKVAVSSHEHEQAEFDSMHKEHGQPEQLYRISCNAVCHLRSVKIIELKPFKAATIDVADV